jgi:chaperonin GroES
LYRNDNSNTEGDKMNIIPLYDRLFVLPDESPEETKGGIILTDYSKKRPTSGTIVAVGSKVKERKVGERIIYGEFSGLRRTINYKGKDTEIFIMTEDDISALLE